MSDIQYVMVMHDDNRATKFMSEDYCKELMEQLAAAQSGEVCTKPHADDVLEFCQACKIESLKARLAEAEQVIGAASEHMTRHDYTEAHWMLDAYSNTSLCPHGLYPWNCRDCTPMSASVQPSPVAFCGPFPECSDDELMLREMLAISYSSAHGGMLYGDDGELQFGGYPHPIDFRRDSVAEIRRKIDARGMAKLIEQQRATDNSTPVPTE